MRLALKNAGFSACAFDVLLNHFYVCAFRQIGEVARRCPLTDGLTENVKNHVSGFAALDFLDVRDSCRSCNGHVEFKADLIASVNYSLFYGVIISGYNFVTEFRRGGADGYEKTGSEAGLWSGKRDSNPRPSAWEADALPTELLSQRVDMFWSRYRDSNPGPTHYECVALPTEPYRHCFL